LPLAVRFDDLQSLDQGLTKVFLPFAPDSLFFFGIQAVCLHRVFLLVSSLPPGFPLVSSMGDDRNQGRSKWTKAASSKFGVSHRKVPKCSASTNYGIVCLSDRHRHPLTWKGCRDTFVSLLFWRSLGGGRSCLETKFRARGLCAFFCAAAVRRFCFPLNSLPFGGGILRSSMRVKLFFFFFFTL